LLQVRKLQLHRMQLLQVRRMQLRLTSRDGEEPRGSSPLGAFEGFMLTPPAEGDLSWGWRTSSTE
jgi:hypothetical protein